MRAFRNSSEMRRSKQRENEAKLGRHIGKKVVSRWCEAGVAQTNTAKLVRGHAWGEHGDRFFYDQIFMTHKNEKLVLGIVRKPKHSEEERIYSSLQRRSYGRNFDTGG
jgi:hypothetical protein